MTELQIIVENLKQAVSESQYSQLVALTNPQIAAIDALTEELDIVAKLKPTDPTRVNYSMTVQAKIKGQLADTSAARQLHLALDNPAPDANDILKAASQVYGTRRWFTAKSSASTEAVYEYFALYQLRLAIVLTNYWKTEHETFSTETVLRLIDSIHTNVNTQKTDRLKPPVPADKFIDTRTMTMWDRKPAWVSGEQYTPIEVCRCTKYAGQYCELRDPNWEDRAKGLGTEEDFRRLIDGWDLNSRCGTPKDPKPCSNPLEWLRKEVELATSSPGNVPRDWSGFMWLGPTRSRGPGLASTAVATTG